jgi:hypothetical protein
MGTIIDGPPFRRADCSILLTPHLGSRFRNEAIDWNLSTLL